jgi:Xaa-Pro aminopeptidase
LVSYFGWLENELVVNGNTELTEYTASKVIDGKRMKNELNMGLSFNTISSIGPNGAIVHYSAEESTAAKLNPN